MWDAAEFPELAANEFFCLSAARAAGLAVPNFQLSEDGAALILDRFDLSDGAYLGFEDFCVLNGLQTADKYSGSYESRLFKRLGDYVGPATRAKSARDLFRLFVLNCALRNGDAHLKNFGILYSDVNGEAELAPVYDLVTTTAYLPQDAMALTLNGTTRWPDARKLIELGQVRANLSKKDIEGILEATADALSDTLGKMRRYFRSSEFPEIGKRIAAAWEEGIRETLQQTANLVPAGKPKEAGQETGASRKRDPHHRKPSQEEWAFYRSAAGAGRGAANPAQHFERGPASSRRAQAHKAREKDAFLAGGKVQRRNLRSLGELNAPNCIDLRGMAYRFKNAA